MKDKALLFIIPAYNEEENIVMVCESARRVEAQADILVVDDGSTDATFREARKVADYVLRLPFNIGVGGAVQTGLRFAHKRGYAAVVRIDGDGQHDPSFARDLLGPINRGEADYVIGSRFLLTEGYHSSFLRRVGIGFFSRLIESLLGVRITDPTSGFVACNKKVIHFFAENYPPDFPEPEAIVLACHYGVRIREIPVVMKARQRGESKIRPSISLYYMLKVTLAILLTMLQKKRKDNQ